MDFCRPKEKPVEVSLEVWKLTFEVFTASKNIRATRNTEFLTLNQTLY